MSFLSNVNIHSDVQRRISGREITAALIDLYSLGAFSSAIIGVASGIFVQLQGPYPHELDCYRCPGCRNDRISQKQHIRTICVANFHDSTFAFVPVPFWKRALWAIIMPIGEFELPENVRRLTECDLSAVYLCPTHRRRNWTRGTQLHSTRRSSGNNSLLSHSYVHNFVSTAKRFAHSVSLLDFLLSGIYYITKIRRAIQYVDVLLTDIWYRLRIFLRERYSLRLHPARLLCGAHRGFDHLRIHCVWLWLMHRMYGLIKTCILVHETQYLR